MRKRYWNVALAAVALIATAMALYVQLFERRERQEADRLAEVRLEESRASAEVIVQRRAEETAAEPPADQPLPGAVLRRGESGSALQQFRDSQDEQAAVLARLQESVDTLTLQMEQSDQALRRDLEQIRAEARREEEASNKTLTLLLVALVPLVLHLLLSLRLPEG